jgi:outer membrane protein
MQGISMIAQQGVVRMKKLLFSALVAGSLTMPVQADTLLGLYIGLDGWKMDSSGSFGSSSEMQDFDLGEDTKVSFFVSLEHFVPFVPNIRLRTNDLSSEGDNEINTEFEYGGETFAVSSVVATDFELTNTDITLYYEIFDNDLISFDLGLTGKYVDGEITVVDKNDSSLRASESFKGVVPLLYGALQVGVPTTGLSFFGEMSALQIDDHTLQDYQAGLAYSFVDNLAIDMSLRAGYREFTLELDDLEDVFTDWSFSGPFLGVQAHF